MERGFLIEYEVSEIIMYERIKGSVIFIIHFRY